MPVKKQTIAIPGSKQESKPTVDKADGITIEIDSLD